MTEEAFQAAIEEAKKLEKKAIEYEPYEGEVRIEIMVEVEPEEYVDLDYKDLYNLYQRTQKILSAAGMGVLAERPPEEAARATAESREVETRLKKMTSERLKEAEEIAREPVVAEEEAPVPPVTQEIEIEKEEPQEIEFEGPPEKPPEKEVEIPFKAPSPEEVPAPEPATPEEAPEVPSPEEKAPEIPEAEKPAKAPAPTLPEPEEPPAPEVEPSLERAPPQPKAVPPTLRETPGEAAARRYEQIEQQIRDMMGEEADERALKKKMLELTKQLFKEKITSKREEIKMQIKVLKNMLAVSGEGRAKKKRAPAQTRLETILASQQEELAHTKGRLIDAYNKQIMQIKEKFYDDMSSIENPQKRKKTYETFVSSVTMLVQNLPDAVKKEKEYLSQKHAAELKRAEESLGAKDKALKKRIKERKDYIQENYDEEFSMVKHIVGKEIENLIEVAGSETFRKPEEKEKKKKRMAEPTEIVKEINETDEGTLLYFLHSKNPDYYKKFERKKISRAEAVFKAKELLAKKKGLSDSMIRKYFSGKEERG
ncbi:hypothetical protein GF318_02940 [Candidatus Micrarchaeota archaeon]|nr:hypothetical protein [Candidatus Micrarchaeota archaeon]